MKIMLDPGHGGKDPGAISATGLKEKDVTLKIGLRLRDKLKNNGFTVLMTRETDRALGSTVNQDLIERADIANRNNADCFVSIHNNAHANTNIRGIETFAYSQTSKGNALAKCIQDSLIVDTRLNNRGVKHANFAVIRRTNMAACLTEINFLSNVQDEVLLKDDSFLDRVSGSISKGICEYFGITYKGDESMFKDDKNISEWARPHIKRVVEFGIMNGNAKNEFNPKEPVTREELAVVASNIVRYINGK